MSEFISDPEAASLILAFGITDDEISDDHLTVTSKLGNSETLIQHREPRQYEYSGTLPDESTPQAPVIEASAAAEPPQAANEAVPPAAALDAQTNAQELATPAPAGTAPAAEATPAPVAEQPAEATPAPAANPSDPGWQPQPPASASAPLDPASPEAQPNA